MRYREALVLFTNEFPYGNGEPFLETEIQYLATSFQTIYIIPNRPHSNRVARELPSNVYTQDIFSLKRRNTFFFLLKHLKKVVFYFFYSFVNENKKYFYLYHCLSYGRYLIKEMIRAEEIESFIKDKNLNNATFYTYWFLVHN